MPYGSDGSRWIFVLYLTLLVWVPIPLGSNRAWSCAILEIWVLLISLLWIGGFLRGKFRFGEVLRNAWPLLWCATAWLGYVWLQLLSWPIEILQLLSPEAARWHTAAASPASVTATHSTLPVWPS